MSLVNISHMTFWPDKMKSVLFVFNLRPFICLWLGSIDRQSNKCSICLNITKISWLITKFVTRWTRRMSLVEQELLTLPEHLCSPPVFSGVRVTRSLFLYCRSLFVHLYLFFWPLCCLFFFDIRILITPLVSSNYSWIILILVMFLPFPNISIILSNLFALRVYQTQVFPWKHWIFMNISPIAQIHRVSQRVPWWWIDVPSQWVVNIRL